MKLATLYEGYSSMDFDLDVATEARSVLCDNYDEAIRWAEATVKEGRDPEVKWEWANTLETTGVAILSTECNEYGSEEESFLFVKDIVKI